MAKKSSDEKKKKEKIENQLKAVNFLASRLPWIAVIVTLISMIWIFFELYLRNQGG